MTLFKVATVILLSFFMPKFSEGKKQHFVMYPDEDDQVLEIGETLNLTCTYNIMAGFASGFNISWNLPVRHLVQNNLVRNMRMHTSSILYLLIFYITLY